MTVLHNLVALSSLAVFLCTSGVAPVAALTTPNHNVVRHLNVAHNNVKAKRNTHKKRCKARPAPPADIPDNGTNSIQSVGDSNNSNSNSGGGNTSNNTPPPPPPPANNGGGGTYTPQPPSGSGKKGLGWPNGEADLDKWGGINWIYTWSPHCPTNAASVGIECVPMLWGWNQVDDFARLTAQDGYARVALGPNEPNQVGQSDMSPDSGVQLWLQYLEPLKSKGYRLGSPATTSAPSGKQWVQDFLNICAGRCSVDFIALHWYDVGVQKFKDYVTDFHNTFNMNIWVTEYACQNFNGGAQCSEGEVYDFLQQTVSWMESTSWIERYAWFGAMRDMQGVNDFDKLMADDGGRNNLGNTYISL